MNDDTLPSGAADLAAGFGTHVTAWARECGAPPAALEALETAALQASLATAEGHVCVPLAEIAAARPATGVDALRDALLASRMVGTPGGEPLPLLLDPAGRLYLRRYYDYECRLAARLAERAAAGAPRPPAPALRQLLQGLFAANRARLGERADWQQLAAALAMRGRLAVVSGGPGTGKTTAVAALLACILAEDPQARIALAAPTGKAAARMLEALRTRAGHLPRELRARLPEAAHTIHRLLGAGGERYTYHARNPLPVDALVVDEASMLDLSLAVRLVEAVPAQARLILLGDKDQLAAVEAGAVFAELSADPALSPQCIAWLAAATGTPAGAIVPPPGKGDGLADAVVWLTESYRFAADSGIGRLAALVNAGAADEALAWLAQGGDASAAWAGDAGADLSPATRRRILEGYGAYFEALRRDAGDVAAVFAAFDRFRVLCALRGTPRGVDAVNALVGEALRAALGLPREAGPAAAWHPGRPVMIRRNDYLLRLFNGDVGICLPDARGQPMVWFPDASGHRAVAPARLPEHDSAWAVTVHKAQGSEFESVLCLLPAEAGRVMVRELLYTAVTRATRSITLAGSADVFRAACLRPTARRSGLGERLRAAPPARETGEGCG